MKYIKKECIDKILDAIDVVSVIEKYVNIKKSGSGYSALSPFGSEKTASLMISPSKQIWKDFSTGKGGSAINFIMEYKSISFYEALLEAAKLNNIAIEYEEFTNDEEKNKYEDYQIKKRITQLACDKYIKFFSELPPTHWAQKMISNRKWDDSTILQFKIGYAPKEKNNSFSKEAIELGYLAAAKELGLTKTNEINQLAYDFFIDRLVFPIQNFYGEVIGFGGRRNDDPENLKYAKYLNSSESILYNKSKILYGLYQAKGEIRKQNKVILVEGYSDVISLHQNGVSFAVATCGTSLTVEHTKILKKLCAHVIIWRDGDVAGLKATFRDIDILLKESFKVSTIISPEGKDPDDLAREKGTELIQWVEDNLTDAVNWKAVNLIKNCETPDDISFAVQKICDTLCVISDEIKRDLYIKDLSKVLKQKQSVLKKIVDEKLDNLKTSNTNITTTNNVKLDVLLPPGANQEQYIKDRFCEIDKAYFFQSKDGNFFKGTNFVIQALFHIYGRNDNKRLCEITNELGHKRLIDFDSKDFVNFSKIQETLIQEGFFFFEGNVSTLHFKLVTKKILNDFIMAYELKTLGWQNEGFFAFADGIYFENQFKRTNKYGIIQIEGLDEENSEYRENIKHYYSPAFSEIYKYNREDDDPYENDRCFVYRKSPISIDQWMSQLVKVYGDKGIVGIGFVFASLFRDILIKRFSFFPHLGLFGEKGSGKSRFGDSLHNFFFYKMNPFDLNSGTVVGFTRRLARTKNAISFLEEYHDNIHDVMFQSMKGAYDGRGREKGQATVDNRTSITNVNSSLIYAGQYYPVRDDNSLATRSLLLSFIKKPYTTEEIQEYNLLKSWEETGLSSLILDIIRHREVVVTKFHEMYALIAKNLKMDLAGTEVQERMINNYLAILTPIYILWDNFNFPFTQEYFYRLCKELIINSSDMITESEGLADFWSMFEYLVHENRIKENEDFKIISPKTVKLGVKKGGKTITEEWYNTNSDKVLYIYFKKIYQDMLRESSRRGTSLMNETTLKNYFRAKKYLIGGSATTRLGERSQSCYAFNYSLLHSQGILNIEKTYILDTSLSSKEKEIPF